MKKLVTEIKEEEPVDHLAHSVKEIRVMIHLIPALSPEILSLNPLQAINQGVSIAGRETDLILMTRIVAQPREGKKAGVDSRDLIKREDLRTEVREDAAAPAAVVKVQTEGKDQAGTDHRQEGEINVENHQTNRKKPQAHPNLCLHQE